MAQRLRACSCPNSAMSCAPVSVFPQPLPLRISQVFQSPSGVSWLGRARRRHFSRCLRAGVSWAIASGVAVGMLDLTEQAGQLGVEVWLHAVVHVEFSTAEQGQGAEDIECAGWVAFLP